MRLIWDGCGLLLCFRLECLVAIVGGYCWWMGWFGELLLDVCLRVMLIVWNLVYLVIG